MIRGCVYGVGATRKKALGTWLFLFKSVAVSWIWLCNTTLRIWRFSCSSMCESTASDYCGVHQAIGMSMLRAYLLYLL